MKITLRAARVNRGLTLKSAAHELGINFQTLQKYEKDSTFISNFLIKKIVELYKIPEEYLFFGSEFEYINTKF